MKIDPKLLAIYRKTSFFVQNLEGKLVRFTALTADKLPFLKKKRFAVITAWNPGARVSPVRLNRERNRRLEKDLKRGGYSFYKTRGVWRGHSEVSFTVEKISRPKALQLGRKYKQYAILYHGASGVEFLRCS
jgi:hypothetical protein